MVDASGAVSTAILELQPPELLRIILEGVPPRAIAFEELLRPYNDKMGGTGAYVDRVDFRNLGLARAIYKDPSIKLDADVRKALGAALASVTYLPPDSLFSMSYPGVTTAGERKKSHEAGTKQLCDRAFKQLGKLKGVQIVYAEFLSWPELRVIAERVDLSTDTVLSIAENVMSGVFGGNERQGGLGRADPGGYNGCMSAVISARIAESASLLRARVKGLEADDAKALVGFHTPMGALLAGNRFTLGELEESFALPSDTPASVAHAALGGIAGA